MSSATRTLWLLSALAGLLPRASATDWYVDGNAPPPGDGSQAAPFPSIQVAIDQPATFDGDVIHVLPGDYQETIDYGQKRLRIRSTGGPLVTSLRPASASDPVVVTLGLFDVFPPPDAILEGFTVTRDVAPPGSAGVMVPLPGAGLLVRCIVTGHDLGIWNEYDVVLQSCTVTANQIGVFSGSCPLSYVESSIVQHNALDVHLTPLAGLSSFHSNVGGLAGLNCGLQGACVASFDLDPRFWSPAAGDWRLRADSPSRDSGDPAAPPDPDGSVIDQGALPYDPFHAPGTVPGCFATAQICPCGNGGSGDAGCDNAQATGGVRLAVRDFLPDGAGGGTAVLHTTGYPPAAHPAALLLRSPALEPTPLPFGDGARCLAATGLVRLNTAIASRGSAANPVAHGAGAGTFHYQVAYRNLPAAFCDPASTFNASSSVAVTW